VEWTPRGKNGGVRNRITGKRRADGEIAGVVSKGTTGSETLVRKSP